MKVLARCALFALLFVVVSLTPSAARADSQTYLVTGTMTFGCSTGSCTETVNFSFEHTCTIEAPFMGITLCDKGALVPGSASATANGVFGPFSMTGYLGPGYIGFNPPSDISQFYINLGPDFFSYAVPTSSVDFAGGLGEMWSCVSQACLNDFGFPGAQLGQGGPIENGTLEISYTVVPEPSTLALLAFGAFLLVFVEHKRIAPTPSKPSA